MRQRGRGGGGRGVATYHTPSIPKSRGRLAPRQIAVASTPRASQRRSGKRRKARSLSRKWLKIIAATATAAARVPWLQRGPPPLEKKRSSRTPRRSSTYQPYVRVRDLQRDRPTDRPTDRRANGRRKRCNEDGTRPGRTTRTRREDGECRTTTAINAGNGIGSRSGDAVPRFQRFRSRRSRGRRSRSPPPCREPPPPDPLRRLSHQGGGVS